MSLTFKANGREYTKYIRLSLSMRLDAMCNSFSMQIGNTNGEALPFDLDDECEVYLNGIKKFTGRIEILDGSYTANSYVISVQGRDKTADLLDGYIYNMKALTGSTTLVQICEAVISHLGVDIKVKVEEGVTIENFNLSEDIFAPASGRKAYGFLEGLAKKRNVLLSSNEEGNLLLTKNNPSESNGKLQNIINDTNKSNNVMEASFSFDNTERYSVCICSSQLSPAALNNAGVFDLTSVVSQSGRATDSEIHSGRQYVFEANTASSDGQNKPRAEWEINMRKARGNRYNAQIDGHSISTDNLEVWEINELVQVRDDLAGISSQMLVDALVFSSSIDNGDITNISATYPEAYSLFVPLDKKISNRNFIGKAIGQDSSRSVVIQEATTKQVEQITGFNSKKPTYNFVPPERSEYVTR